MRASELEWKFWRTLDMDMMMLFGFLSKFVGCVVLIGSTLAVAMQKLLLYC